jgi:hypothetical protein
MSRLPKLFVLAGASLLLTPMIASAQFVRPFGLPGGFPGIVPIVPPVRLVPTVPIVPPIRTVPIVQPVPLVPPVRLVNPVPFVQPVPLVPPVRLVNPVIALPQFRFQQSSFVTFGGFTVGSTQFASGTAGWAFRPVNNFVIPYTGAGAYLGTSSGYAGIDAPELDALAQAQREASLRASLSGGIASRNPMPAISMPEGSAPTPIAPRRATAEGVAVGEALNGVLEDIVRAQSKGASGPSAYIPPLLLKDMRFAGSPAADLLNFTRQSGLAFPAALDTPLLADQRNELTKEFAGAAEIVRTGKAPDAARAARVEAAFRSLEEASAPVLKDLPADTAADAKRFLGQLGNAIQALKGGAANGLVNPNWVLEGLTGAELVKHMTKYKLQFGPAPRGAEEAYGSMHDNLSAYLYMLNQPKR